MSNHTYIYTYGYRPEEKELFQLETRTFFGKEAPNGYIISTTEVDPDRSAFMRERLEVMYAGPQLEDLIEQARQIDVGSQTFKVIFLKNNDLTGTDKISYDNQRKIEHQFGVAIEGEADMRTPDITFAVIALEGHWYFGYYQKSKAKWLEHMHKPRGYSIALSTRVARAIANIAVPHPTKQKVIDPCCGIGTVLVEALSMGINIVGSDINHFVVKGTRENLAHFNLQTSVKCMSINDIEEHYDIAIIDLPYNHFSHATDEDVYSLLKEARRIADRVLIVSVGSIDDVLHQLSYTIVDRCTTRKGNFVRQIILCH